MHIFCSYKTVIGREIYIAGRVEWILLGRQTRCKRILGEICILMGIVVYSDQKRGGKK